MTLRMFVSAATTLALILGLSATPCALADPCLVAYPDGPCTYHYDPAEHYTVKPGDPLYDPIYDRGGQVLLRIGTNEVDLSIYQAPQLMGFVAATDGNDGFFFEGRNLKLTIDGFSHDPTTYVNILVAFDDFVPELCSPTIYANGLLLTDMVYHAGDLVVQTPTPDGNNYSDVLTINVSWQGCYGVHVWAFSDEDYDGIRDGRECFTAFSHDIATPIGDTTWGRIKALYR